MTIVSNNIKYLRRLNGLTQEQFSRKIGIKRSLLGAYEEARANPNLDNLQNMAKIFGTTVDALIKTDIRKIRETPGLNYQNSAISFKENFNKNDAPKEITPISSVIDQYFTDVPMGHVNNVNESEGIHHSTIEDYSSPKNDYQPQGTNLNYQENNFVNSNQSIPFVNRHELTNYINSGHLKTYLGSLPQISLPNLKVTPQTRAMTVADDFPLPNATIIAEIVDRNTQLADGQHHLIVCKDGRLLFRRVYDHTRHKGCYLLSSDEQHINSTEIAENQVFQLLKYTAFIATEIPKSNKLNPRLKNLIEELYQESGKQ
jgi:transcriptional regulator with XRE-family HTH domain